jgi:signal transduction histidine kinase
MSEPQTEPPADILLVDDRRENLLALEAVLRPLGHRIVTARSGEEALRCLLDDEFAVILMDVRMPGMDGFETASEIKRRERTSHIPIIFLTAVDSDPYHALRGYSEGAVDYIAKPFDAWVLRSKVTVFVELHKRGRRLREQAEALQQSNAELQQLAEAAQAASRAKSSFLSMVGHELRTPLTVIAGYASLLEEGAFGEVGAAMQKPVRILSEKADELREMVEAVLTAAMVEAGELPAEATVVDLRELAEAAVQRARSRTDLIGGSMSLELPEVAAPAHVDPAHAARIVDNLLNNALSYGGQPPRVAVRVGADPPSISVEDGGDGIPQELHERIFERFVRGSGAGQGPPGVGLGLYICREYARQSGGELVLERSEQGRGSVFTLRLPPVRMVTGNGTSEARASAKTRGRVRSASSS